MQTVILCGGAGTRSYPFTDHYPKPMMPVCGRPILVHIMRLYAEQGFTRFVLAAGHRQEVLFDYFEGRFPEWDVRILDTGKDSDTGERIRRCSEFVGDTFFATYGDGIGDVRLHDLLAFHKASGGMSTLTTVPLRSQYGTVHFDERGRVDRFQEKPVIRDCWINAGFFVFEKRVFDFWEGQNLESEVFPALVRRGEVHTYRHEGFWKSMDTSKDQQELERLFQCGEAKWSLGNGSHPGRVEAAAPRIGAALPGMGEARP
ncbi:MAG: NTP transferase domain-containing protein [Candidatus Eisenbacteria bacterium]|nr:NTP transferase domain-containing protein [Candidatus Eisenbacteria bacterium]